MQPIAHLRRITCLLTILALPSLCCAVSKLTISPANPRQLSNSSLQFTSTLNKNDVTGKVQWRSSNPAVATIAAGGLATLLAPGTTTITAANGSVRASTSLTVTTAVSPTFRVQPSDTNVSATINSNVGGVKVLMLDNLGDPLPSQKVTVSIGANPPGTGTLSGMLTQTTDSTGTASFSDLNIDWLGTGYTLVASSSPSSGAVSGTSATFNELRVGDPCKGPDTPACNGTCADADGDGLNDAWEQAGGVDINGDGLITDSTHDLLLTGADPNKPDIFVQYDWMDYGPPGNACTVDTDCSGLGLGHHGETCSGPQLIPSAPASCRYSCNVDSDCTSRSAFTGDTTHAQEKCQANTCVHTHDPAVTSPTALQAVVDRFAVHGINLHLIRGNPQPHSTVLSFRRLNELADSCEGGSLVSGDAGPGKYAESIYDLKEKSSPDAFNIVRHYTVFGHYGSCDTSAHCNLCPAATNPDGSPKNAPVAGESGIAEISGNDFIVSLGNRVQDLAIAGNTLSDGGTFMHELGHNLGLHHGGGIEEPCQDQSQCHVGYTCSQTSVGKYCIGTDDTTWKPNYLSVMNYRFQFTGITSAVAVGSTQTIACTADLDCPSGNYCRVPPQGAGVCSRLDFSSQTLPTSGNTPGALEERNTDGNPGLNEPAGLGSGTADLTSFFDSMCDVPVSLAPTDGPVDWSGNGDFLETNVSADLNGVDHVCGTLFSRLSGSTDWPEISGLNFTYGFQCTPYGGAGGDIRVKPGAAAGISKRSVPHNLTGGELSPKMAMEAHLLYPLFSAKIMVHPGCSSPSVAAGQKGTLEVALLGEKTLDVAQVEHSSLKFAGASPIAFAIRDVNSDGIPDLLLTFDTSQMKLSPGGVVGRLSGWLKNSQAFSGEQAIRVVDSLAAESPNCR